MQVDSQIFDMSPGQSRLGTPILVTGASGTVGLEVVRRLTVAGCLVRAGTRDGTWSGDSADGMIVPIALDFMKPKTWPDAVVGIDRVFLMRPPAISDVKTHINPFIDLASKAGVKHIVLLSLLGAEKIPVVPHRKIELHLEQSNLAHTFLRPSFFMQNLSTTHRDEIGIRNEIAVPAGKGKTSFVDVRDIADVAVRVLTETGHEGKAYSLTGSEALGYAEVADMLSEGLERKITYTNPSLPSFFIRMLREKNPFGFAMVTSAIYMTARFGMAGKVTPELEQILGRPPIAMRQFIDDYRNAWMPTERAPAATSVTSVAKD